MCIIDVGGLTPLRRVKHNGPVVDYALLKRMYTYAICIYLPLVIDYVLQIICNNLSFNVKTDRPQNH